MYDGPFCVPSIVANRTFRPILFDVLDHDPTHADVERFIRRLQSPVKQRGLERKGITTDGSTLYPEPISKVVGDAPHQNCEFPVIRELTKAVLRPVARVRKELAADKPKWYRGRPSSAAARQVARRCQRMEQKVSDLFRHRHLVVPRGLTPAQRWTHRRITRGRPELRTLGEIRDGVYRLCDRRRRTATALDRSARLRRRVGRFNMVGKTLQKLLSPNLEKALTILDGRLLQSTSNAVERGYRRRPKIQKAADRVRTQPNFTARMALGMQREVRPQLRDHTTATLHATCVRTAA